MPLAPWVQDQLKSLESSQTPPSAPPQNEGQSKLSPWVQEQLKTLNNTPAPQAAPPAQPVLKPQSQQPGFFKRVGEQALSTGFQEAGGITKDVGKAISLLRYTEPQSKWANSPVLQGAKKLEQVGEQVQQKWSKKEPPPPDTTSGKVANYLGQLVGGFAGVPKYVYGIIPAMGWEGIDAYDNAIKQGKSPQDALTDGLWAGADTGTALVGLNVLNKAHLGRIVGGLGGTAIGTMQSLIEQYRQGEKLNYGQALQQGGGLGLFGFLGGKAPPKEFPMPRLTNDELSVFNDAYDATKGNEMEKTRIALNKVGEYRAKQEQYAQDQKEWNERPDIRILSMAHDEAIRAGATEEDAQKVAMAAFWAYGGAIKSGASEDKAMIAATRAGEAALPINKSPQGNPTGEQFNQDLTNVSPSMEAKFKQNYMDLQQGQLLPIPEATNVPTAGSNSQEASLVNPEAAQVPPIEQPSVQKLQTPPIEQGAPVTKPTGEEGSINLDPAQVDAKWEGIREQLQNVRNQFGLPTSLTGKLKQGFSDVMHQFNRLLAPGSNAEGMAGIFRQRLAEKSLAWDQALNTLSSINDVLPSLLKEGFPNYKPKPYDLLQRSEFQGENFQKQLDFMDMVEHGKLNQIADPRLREVGRLLNDVLKSRRDIIDSMGEGAKIKWRDNYMARFYDEFNPQGSIAGKSPLEGKKSFLNHRVFEYYSDAIKAGLHPASDNIVDFTLQKANEMDKFIMASKTLKDGIDHGYMKVVNRVTTPQGTFGKNDIPDGWVKMDTDNYFVKSKKGQVIGVNSVLYTDPDVKKLFDNYLAPGLSGSSIYRGYRWFGNTLNMFQLGLSAFHIGFTTLDAVTSKLAISMQQLAEAGKQTVTGQPEKGMEFAWEGLKGLGKVLLVAPAVKENVQRGMVLARALNSIDPKTISLLNDDAYSLANSSDPEVARVALGALMGGAHTHMDQIYVTRIADNMARNFREGDLGNDVMGALRIPGAIIETAMDPILKFIVPMQKMGVISDGIRFELEKMQASIEKTGKPFNDRQYAQIDPISGRPVTEQDIERRIFGQWVDSVDNRMGQFIYDNYFWNKTFKDILMASIRSVGWNTGTVKEIGGGILDAATVFNRLAKGDPILTQRMAYVASLTIMTGLVNSMGTYLMTGRAPRDAKDVFLRIPAGVYDKMGNEFGWLLPMYSKDIAAYAIQPVQTILNKLNPAIETTVDLLRNRDFWGADIYNINDPLYKQGLEALKYVAMQGEPFSSRNIRKGILEQGLSVTPFLSMVGVTPAPSYLTETPIQRDIVKMYHTRFGTTRSQEDAAIQHTRSQLRFLYQKIRGMPQGEEKLTAEEKFNAAYISEIERLKAMGAARSAVDLQKSITSKKLNIPPDVRMFGRLSPYDEWSLLKGMSIKDLQRYAFASSIAVRHVFGRGLPSPDGSTLMPSPQMIEFVKMYTAGQMPPPIFKDGRVENEVKTQADLLKVMRR